MRNKRNTFAVIGLGRFGMSVARKLLEAGKDVICIDNDMAKIRSLSSTNARLCHIETISYESLMEAGVAESDVCVIGIGKDLEANILASMDAISCGVNRVISKANNSEHARILQKIGAEVVYPEVETANRLGLKLINDLTEDVIPLSDDFFIMQFNVPAKLDGKTILETDLRHKYAVNVIAIIHNGKANATIRPDSVMYENDSIVVSGSAENVNAMQKGFAN